MPRRNRKNLANEIDTLAKTGKWGHKPETLGADIEAVTPDELKKIVEWGYQTHSYAEVAVTSKEAQEETNRGIAKLLYQYIGSNNAAGVRLIARATKMVFNLNQLPLFEVEKHPLKHAVLSAPSMLPVLLEESTNQGIKQDILKPYIVASHVHQEATKLYPLVQASWDTFCLENFKDCHPSNPDFVKNVQQHLFSSKIIQTLIENTKHYMVDPATLSAYQVVDTLRKNNVDLYTQCKAFISAEAPKLEKKWDFSFHSTPKATLFKELNDAFTPQAFYQALSEVDFSHCKLDSDNLAADVLDTMFKQTNGLFHQMQEAFDKRRLGWGKPGTEGRLLDDLKSHLSKDAATATP